MASKLSVNINKIATLRNARGGNVPNVLQMALDIEKFGADGITVHPRPDGRHIRYSDVVELKQFLTTEFNIEGYPGREFIDMVIKVRPAQVTLVPDPPDAITSNAGWDTLKNTSFLKEIVSEFKNNGIRVSIFLDPNPEMVESAAKTGTDRIELYTEAYATQYFTDKSAAIAPFKETARKANQLGLGVNAGHDLSLQNLRFFAREIPELLEVSIGHALISDALVYGMENTVAMYKRELLGT